MKVINLDRFVPRDYQYPLVEAVEKDHFRKIIAIWPRRSGKDVVAWNLLIREAIRVPANYYYCLPTFKQARLVIFESITNSGMRFLDFIPRELISNINKNEMSIELINGSKIRLIGSDTYDSSLVGGNPKWVIFSEFALAREESYLYVRPILNSNDGTVIILSTPRGRSNHLFKLYEIAKDNPRDWFCSKLTLDDTKHIPVAAIKAEIASGEISGDMVDQEYYTSFNLGSTGAYYSKYLDEMNLNGQIGVVPHEPSFKVMTCWDIGMRDSTSIIFFQVIGQQVRIINSYEASGEGLEHYVKVLDSMKHYTYGHHIAPHDIKVREWGSGLSRLEKAKRLGISFKLASNISIMDGIEAVRSSLSKIWINESTCKSLIDAISNYRQSYDSKRKVYTGTPLHDQYSHMADALRYLCVSLPKLKDGLSASDLDKIRQETLYGSSDPFFGNNIYR